MPEVTNALDLAHLVEMSKAVLPDDHTPYIDKYFLRSREILEKDGLNPWVSAQVFIRKGPGTIHGIDEAIAILEKYGKVTESGGQIWHLNEGAQYESGEVIMRIVAPIQNIVDLETMYLGVIAAKTTEQNDWVCLTSERNLSRIKHNVRKVVEQVGDRPVFYFGARHWHWLADADIAAAAAAGGAVGCSTDIGAQAMTGEATAQGVGTIPHALENIYAWALERDMKIKMRYNTTSPVVAATDAFNRYMNPEIPRIALIDYSNKEVQDAVACAARLKGKLTGVRIDTCGENVGQGVSEMLMKEFPLFLNGSVSVPHETSTYIPKFEKPYWMSSGVSILGTLAVRDALDQHGYTDTQITLSSGFGNPDKVAAFVDTEEKLGRQLFDGLGVGQLYPARSTTMDITMIGESPDEFFMYSKTGRMYKHSSRLVRFIGGENGM